MRISKHILPKKIYVHADAAADSMVKRVISRHPEAQVERVTEYGDPLSQLGLSGDKNKLSHSEAFSLGKQHLLLSRYRGSWLRACPGTQDHVCCNLWTLNPGEGCPMDCTYCYLQSYLRRNPTLKLYTNTWDMFSEIEHKLSEQPGRFFRIGTGEVIDSLVWDELTDSSVELVEFFSRLPNAALELKTKSNFVDNLVDLKNSHNGNTVVAWSVNAEQVIENDEAYTASLSQRIEAACRVVEAGYRVGFHFDPLIHFCGWEDAYRDAIEKIFSAVSVKNVAWVSVSSLRYPRIMQSIMEERFGNSKIPYGDQILASDSKLRYIQPLRFKLNSFVWNQLKQVSELLPVYMCMESAAAWRNIAGGAPAAGSELVEIFSRKGKQRVIQQKINECST